MPSRNEEFLKQTTDDLLTKIQGDTEILVALDNWEIERPILDPRIKVCDTFRGQRGATNALARLSQKKYVLKLDAHVSFSDGFDVEMEKDMQDDIVLVPALGNLHAYNWVCEKGHKHFQGKYEECEQCGSKELTKEIVWQIIPKPIMSSFYFDTTLHFQYSEIQSTELVSETMSLQGSCFMTSRKMYWERELCDETLGSWGSQGTEVACKTWLSGGRVLSTKKAFYGHQFRETEGFPYLNPVESIFKARETVQSVFLNNAWPKQIRSIQWLISKFGYPGDWSEEAVDKLCKPFIR